MLGRECSSGIRVSLPKQRCDKPAEIRGRKRGFSTSPSSVTHILLLEICIWLSEMGMTMFELVLKGHLVRKDYF